MSRITDTFAGAREENRAAIAVYVTVGFPDVDATIESVHAAIAGGADIIELGVPFSDPLADGATIQRTSGAALAGGVTLRTCLDTARRLRDEGVDAPIYFMGYYNPFFHYGLERLATDAVAAGLDGFIVPDLPPEEAGGMDSAIRPYELDLVFLLAPTSTTERIAQVAGLARGFIYCVSLTGVTGARDAVSTHAPDLLARVRAHSALPLALGFGISRPEHVQTVARDADAVVIGSAMMSLIEDTPPATRTQRVTDYIRSLTSSATRETGAETNTPIRSRP